MDSSDVEILTCPHGVAWKKRGGEGRPSTHCADCQREALARMDEGDWAALHGAVSKLPRSPAEVKPIRGYRLPSDPKAPTYKPDEILARVKADVERYLLKDNPQEERGRNVLGIPQPGGLVLTATDGPRAILEPGESSREVLRVLCPPAGAQLIASSDLALALKRVGCLSPERPHNVLWTWEGPRLTLSASSPEGVASEWFPVNDPGDGVTRRCGLNWQYILPIFGRVPVVMTWSSRQPEIDPLVFHPEGASWRYVVMPMRF